MPQHSTTTGGALRTYTFRVVVEPDDDRWHAYCPALERHGAATWGYSQEDAIRNIHQVVEMVVQSMREMGEPIPTEHASDELAVSVTV